MKRVLIATAFLAGAYAVGWASDAFLNDDPCIDAGVMELDRVEYVERWFPARTDCRITSPSGTVRLERGSPEVFLSMSGLTLVAALALLADIGLRWRAALVALAATAAFVVIFVA